MEMMAFKDFLIRLPRKLKDDGEVTPPLGRTRPCQLRKVGIPNRLGCPRKLFLGQCRHQGRLLLGHIPNHIRHIHTSS